MDPEVLKAFIGAVKEIMLRAAGSKRQFSFFAWLVFLGLVKPGEEVLLVSAGMLLMLWWLFIRFPSNDSLPASKEAAPAAGPAATPA